MGQATGFNAGVFYIMDFGKKPKKEKKGSEETGGGSREAGDRSQ
jgi:hypothetical protein